MTAAFSAGPYLLELIETAAGENSSSYFPLLDRIASGYFKDASTDSELYDRFVGILHQDGHITDPAALSTFNLALSLRSAAPRIEAHYQHYATAIAPFVEDAGCDTWVLFDRKQYCTPELETVVRDELFSSVVKTLPFDRILGAGREAILFANPTSSEFANFHRKLTMAAGALALNYRVRYRPDCANVSRTLHIGGYGVQLALKKTDYIVIDDRDKEQTPDRKASQPWKVLDGVVEESTELKPLSNSELVSVGMKAASFIQHSEDPFETLVKVSQDFPKYASFLSSQNVSSTFFEEHQTNKVHRVRDGINSLWINGAQLVDRQIEPFTLVDILRRERKLVGGIQKLGFDGLHAAALLGHQAISSARDKEESPRYDWTDRLEGGQVILWLNDLELDERYESYPKAVSSLLQRTYPGQMPPIGLNLFNVVFTADLTNMEDLQFLQDVISILDRGIPVRFGLVPLQNTSHAASQAKVAYFLSRNYGIETVLSFIEQTATQDRVWDGSLFASITNGRSLSPNGRFSPLDTILSAEEWDAQLQITSKWINRLQADTAVRPLFVNGVAIPRDPNWMQTMSMTIGDDLQTVQKGVYHGDLDDKSSIFDMFLDEARSRRNMYIAQNDGKPVHMLNVATFYNDNARFLEAMPILDASEGTTRESWAAITVLADLSSAAGLHHVLSALNFKRENPGVRLDLINTHRDVATSSRVTAALKNKENELIEMRSVNDLQSIIQQLPDFDTTDFYGGGLTRVLRNTKMIMGSNGIILNGRVVGPIVSGTSFSSDDFQELLDYERRLRIFPVYAAIEGMDMSSAASDPLAAAKLTSIVALSTISDIPEGIFESAPTTRSSIYDTWNSSHTAIERGNPETASVHIVGLLDPASEKAQRWAPILNTISRLDGIYVKVILNPKEKVDKLPVKRFFRYVIDARPVFENDGSLKTLKATFTGLPSDVLMTAGLDVPPAWLVAPKSSLHDLDNIRLSAVGPEVQATYQLQHILIEGHSRESTGSAPRGAQLVLSTESQPFITDTIIMANLGFFQFKANPGIYSIKLKEGRSREIFSIESIGAHGREPMPGDEETELVLMDFQGATVYPRLIRRPGMGNEDVLADRIQDSHTNKLTKGLKFAKALLRNMKGKSTSGPKHADINIFSVASGHLYERMLNIMIVSVMRNTDRSVKFWFIEQFLSPSFKQFVPHLAEAYGFSYEMVTYKWPHWLRQQKEKQREIWGYKILFLDVLFPLSLDKVIFVDADQIIRTDMMDLVDLDLNGAPYGFTPMCDSRTEMEGFRFWKQGYWSNYLRGRPYHISALYVVDLRRFRELAAGDRLRQQYHALSADPASLSNLDQDLPNHMQFQIPIYSLPQEWLWCETWCSDDSLKQARTIDLCNNPLTKEPKLDRAKRQVPEWTSYDEEIAVLEAKKGLGRASDILAGEQNPPASAARAGEAERKFIRGHTIDEL